jgi:hypothetical protein
MLDIENMKRELIMFKAQQKMCDKVSASLHLARLMCFTWHLSCVAPELHCT